MRVVRLVLIVAVVAAGYAGVQAWLSYQTPAEQKADRVARSSWTLYTLPPQKMAAAVELGRTRRELTVGNEVLTPAVLLMMVLTGAARRMQQLVRRLSTWPWIQGFVFVLLLLLVVEVFSLPLQIWAHIVGLRSGLSVQGWASWAGDRAKWLGLEWALGGLMTMLLLLAMRKSPHRWWVWFWVGAAACTVAGVFFSPYVIDPLFNQFEPLTQSNPALVDRLERVVERGGLSIPPQRMFLMKASAKSTQMNAYVTGFGASKRVVVWDTTAARSTPDEIAFIFAHEMGHYALGHVVLGTALACAGLLPLFWAANACLSWVLQRYGPRLGIASEQDWGALVILALMLLTISTLSEPFANSLSRAMEHAADVYGQEAVHGIVADPQRVAVESFQILGEQSLEDPAPHPVFDWWFGTHPPLWYRAGFAAAYEPWTVGAQPKYFKPEGGQTAYR